MSPVDPEEQLLLTLKTGTPVRPSPSPPPTEKTTATRRDEKRKKAVVKERGHDKIKQWNPFFFFWTTKVQGLPSITEERVVSK